VHWWNLSVPVASLLVTLWVLKDFALFPFLRIAYEPRGPGGANDLIGSRVLVETPLSPAGYARVGAELWRVELTGERNQLPAGSTVRVRAVRGLTLLVEPETSQEGQNPASS
jgi:membrane protein implicated in regulation of membrane protease activity